MISATFSYVCESCESPFRLGGEIENDTLQSRLLGCRCERIELLEGGLVDDLPRTWVLDMDKPTLHEDGDR